MQIIIRKGASSRTITSWLLGTVAIAKVSGLHFRASKRTFTEEPRESMLWRVPDCSVRSEFLSEHSIVTRARRGRGGATGGGAVPRCNSTGRRK